MLAILNSLNAHYLSIFQPILMILVSKFMVHRALSDKTYILFGLLSPLMYSNRLHAWWSTQSRLATLLSSLIARQWVGHRTLWQF